jgi:hypothetical protein
MVRTRLNFWNSLLGWSSILLAGLVYAVLTLAPRIVVRDELIRQQSASAVRLEQLHEQTRQMDEIVAAIESDPKILDELARSEWRVETDAEETIAVDSTLQTNLFSLERQPRVEVAKPPAYVVWLQAVGSDESLRGKLMLAAIALCLVAILSAPRERRINVTQ